MQRESWKYTDHLFDNKPIPVRRVQKGFHYEGELFRGMEGYDLTDIFKLFGRRFLKKGDEFRYPSSTVYSSWSKTRGQAESFTGAPRGGWGILLSTYVREKDTYLDLEKKGLYKQDYSAQWEDYDDEENYESDFGNESEVIVKPGVLATIEEVNYPYVRDILWDMEKGQDPAGRLWYQELVKHTTYPAIVHKYINFVLNTRGKL